MPTKIQELQDQIARKEGELLDLWDSLRREEQRLENEKYKVGAIWQGATSGALYMYLSARRVIRLTPGSGSATVGEIQEPAPHILSLNYLAPSLKEAKDHI